ncbi:hypothetical protein SDC9_140822 [bioreactor metagenome]|uniref:Uncharacterized protein n=1 Tax=bioreactor metagenome TaxID=1076179 RepID=A0A645DVZ4_9ZZZZ
MLPADGGKAHVINDVLPDLGGLKAHLGHRVTVGVEAGSPDF